MNCHWLIVKLILFWHGLEIVLLLILIAPENAQNRYLNHLINPSFQEVNRLFILSFESENDRISHSTYYLPKVEIKDYYVMIDDKNFFDEPINSMTKTYENIRKIDIGQRDDYTTGCLLDYDFFKNHYKMIAIDLSKQQAFDADPSAIQQINFTANLDRTENTTMFFIIDEAKETVLGFPQGTVKVLWMQFSNLRKAFSNHLLADIKLSKIQLSKMIKSGGFLDRLLGPLLKIGLPLISNVIKPLATSVLTPLGLTA